MSSPSYHHSKKCVQYLYIWLTTLVFFQVNWCHLELLRHSKREHLFGVVHFGEGKTTHFLSYRKVKYPEAEISGSVLMAAFNFLEREKCTKVSLTSHLWAWYVCFTNDELELQVWLAVYTDLIPPELSVLLERFYMLWPLSWCLWQHLSKAHQHASADLTQGLLQSVDWLDHML